MRLEKRFGKDNMSHWPPSAPIPSFLYGTAWKEGDTRRCVEEAVAAGFRGIDTANQPRHYHEPGVGEALQAVYKRGGVSRDQLFLQTKFTPQSGQDHRLPYDPSAPVSSQVHQSFAKSLEHLQTVWLDSLLLHGPTQAKGLVKADWQVWRAFEALFRKGQVVHLGVSNMDRDQLEELLDGAEVLPTFVQNRCFARPGLDRAVREYCTEQGLVYQGFSLLMGLPVLKESPELLEISQRHRKTPAQIVFRFVLELGVLPLTGTTDRRHMEEDLKVLDFRLPESDVRRIEVLLRTG